LDVGSSTGTAARILEKNYRAQIYCIDLSMHMLKVAAQKKGWFSRQHIICADAQALPFKDASIDLIFSNLTLQWCPDLLLSFCEFFRVLKPGGALFFTTLGPDTLKELRQSFAQVDDFTHVNTFKDMHDIGDLLLHARFVDPIIDREDLTLTYATLQALIKDLKYTGTHTVLGKQQKGLMGKNKWAQLQHAYEAFRNAQGVLPATYEVIYGHAIKPDLLPIKSKPREPIFIPVGAITRSGAGI
ncbi:MAG TPA: malonyl-ACP O-methyltransferase BioC, partial [Gammaproteobacteria bacterium]|nr:malonyl-ACP O-methyltransferase BioC [Gammaproteobacteria bacterium]